MIDGRIQSVTHTLGESQPRARRPRGRAGCHLRVDAEGRRLMAKGVAGGGGS